jgi:hypothetical protein
MSAVTPEQAAMLGILANAVIPADDIDRGAAEGNAGPVLAARIDGGINAGVYLRGLEAADSLAKARFGGSLTSVKPDQALEILLALKTAVPGFYKQLRADVCALYLSEPAVWKLIGFPGPSSETGGYPDFDQPQFL